MNLISSIWKLAVFLAGVIVGAVTLLLSFAQVFPSINDIIYNMLTYKSEVNIALLSSISIIVALIAIFIFLSQHNSASNKIYALKVEINAKDSIINRLESDLLQDYVTGIPNQHQFKKDFLKVKNEVSRVNIKNLYHLIFIDINNFGEINESLGYEVGDRIIKYFAISISESMRRNEHIYKMPYNVPDENYNLLRVLALKFLSQDKEKDKFEDNFLWRRAYRKYSGGDEFLILTSGLECDAVGFLNRLERRVRNEMNPYIKSEIIKSASDWSLSFSGAVVRVNHIDTEESILERLHDAMRTVRQSGSRMRVCWESNKSSTRIETDNDSGKREKDIYAEAEELFRRSNEGA